MGVTGKGISPERAKEVIKFNREVIYHLPPRYEALTYYLTGALRETLFSVFKFILRNQVIMAKHKYLFFVDNKKLAYGIRKKHGEATANRHINLLCAIGLFTKQKPSRQSDVINDVNKGIRERNPKAKAPINAFSYRKYTPKELKRMEDRAERLKQAGVTAGNFCQSLLSLHGLEDMASEVLPSNNPAALARKMEEAGELLEVLDFLIDNQGYALRQQVKDNLPYDNSEIDKLFKIFRKDLKESYCYKRPTMDERGRFGLKSSTFIYTRRG